MIKTIHLLGFTALVTLPAMAHAVVVAPLSGVSNVAAQVSEIVDGASDFQNSVDTWLVVPQNLSASASATVTDMGGGTITAHGDAAAQWASATAGTVTLRNYGWDYVNSTGGQAIVAGGTAWSYGFTPATDALFTWNYDVKGHDSVFGLWGFQLNLDGNDIGDTQDAFNPDSSGTFNVNLNGGQTYLFALYSNANIESGGTFSGYMDGNFDWAITARGGVVPEPASWAMLITGFGLIGASLRTRRRITA